MRWGGKLREMIRSNREGGSPEGSEYIHIYTIVIREKKSVSPEWNLPKRSSF